MVAVPTPEAIPQEKGRPDPRERLISGRLQREKPSHVGVALNGQKELPEVKLFDFSRIVWRVDEVAIAVAFSGFINDDSLGLRAFIGVTRALREFE